MTTTPSSINEDDRVTEIPRVCRLLFNALVDSVLLGAPLSVAADLVPANPGAAILLRDHLQAGLGDDIECDRTIVGRRLRPLVLNVLRPIVARQVARGVVNEIEANEDEKMNHDAEPIPAREEHHDAEKFTEPENPDAYQPWLV